MSFYWIWSRHPEVKNTHLFECLLEKQNFKNLECQIRIRTIILINVISEWDSEKMPLLRKTSYKKEKKKSLELYQSQRLLCTSNDWNPWGQPKPFQGAKGTQLFFTALQLRNPTPTNKQQQQSKCISLSGSNWFAVYFFHLKKKKKNHCFVPLVEGLTYFPISFDREKGKPMNLTSYVMACSLKQPDR